MDQRKLTKTDPNGENVDVLYEINLLEDALRIIKANNILDLSSINYDHLEKLSLKQVIPQKDQVLEKTEKLKNFQDKEQKLQMVDREIDPTLRKEERKVEEYFKNLTRKENQFVMDTLPYPEMISFNEIEFDIFKDNILPQMSKLDSLKCAGIHSEIQGRLLPLFIKMKSYLEGKFSTIDDTTFWYHAEKFHKDLILVNKDKLDPIKASLLKSNPISLRQKENQLNKLKQQLLMQNECRALDEIYEAKDCLKSINMIVGKNAYTRSVENVKAMDALRQQISEKKKEGKQANELKNIQLDTTKKVSISKKIEGEGIVQSPRRYEQRLQAIFKERIQSNVEELSTQEKDQFKKLKAKFEVPDKHDFKVKSSVLAKLNVRSKTPMGKVGNKTGSKDKLTNLNRDEKKQLYKKNRLDGLLSDIKGKVDENRQYLADLEEKRRIKYQEEEEEKNRKHY